MLLVCKEKRNSEEACVCLVGTRCRALNRADYPCGFYKPKSVAEEQERQMIKRLKEVYRV